VNPADSRFDNAEQVLGPLGGGLFLGIEDSLNSFRITENEDDCVTP